MGHELFMRISKVYLLFPIFESVNLVFTKLAKLTLPRLHRAIQSKRDMIDVDIG